MAKVQLTIETGYLPNWGVYEGIREIVQNAKDAEVEHHAPMTIDWYNDTLRIENAGVVLPLKVLLFGHTTKLGNSQMIGKFGEGLKLAMLALVRAGHDVKIRNGDEVWVPSFEHSETFDDKVLTFRIDGGREARNRVRIEIGGVTKESWEKMKEGFLFLRKPKKDEQVLTHAGTLLLGDKYKGRIYVKGIFVQSNPDTDFGYDLQEVELDRDRKMVESWNLKYHTRNVFLAAMNKKDELFEQFHEMLETPTLETEGLDPTYCSISPEAAGRILGLFQAKHGPNAIPVANLSESKDVEHLGKKGVVVSKPLGAVLAKTLGDAFTVREGLKKETLKTYGWGELTAQEQSVLSGAVELVNEVERIGLENIDIVDFRSDTLNGQFKDDGGRILIAKKLLTSADDTLCTLIHEVAHRQGADGNKSHVQCIEHIWTGVVRNLRLHLNNRFGRVN